MEDFGSSSDGGNQCRTLRNSLLGQRYRRVCANEGVHRGAICTVVSIQRLLPVVSMPWTHMETASSVGMESRKLWPRRVRRPVCRVGLTAARRASQRSRGGDLQEIFEPA